MKPARFRAIPKNWTQTTSLGAAAAALVLIVGFPRLSSTEDNASTRTPSEVGSDPEGIHTYDAQDPVDSVLEVYLQSLPRPEPGYQIVMDAADSSEAEWWSSFLQLGGNVNELVLAALERARQDNEDADIALTRSSQALIEAELRFAELLDSVSLARRTLANAERSYPTLEADVQPARTDLQTALDEAHEAGEEARTAASSAETAQQRKSRTIATLTEAQELYESLRVRLDSAELTAMLNRPLVIGNDVVPVLYDGRADNAIGLAQCVKSPVIYLAKSPRYPITPEAFLFFREHEMGHFAHGDVSCPGRPGRHVNDRQKELEADCFAVSVLDSFPKGHIPIYSARNIVRLLPSDSRHPEPVARSDHMLDGC